MRQPEAVIFGDETFSAARQRFMMRLHALVNAHSDQTLLLVSHGRILSMALAHIAGRDPVAIWDNLQMPAYVILSYPEFTISQWVNEVQL